MANLKDFFRDLLNWEEQQPAQTVHGRYQELHDTVVSIDDASEKDPQSTVLIHEWPRELQNKIVCAFKDTVSKASVKNSVCSIKPGATNQAIGNHVEKYVAQKLANVMSKFSISKCQGNGYPDKVLIQQSANLRIPLEMEATANWNEKDSNRRVLTSSSQKLRNQFCTPIYHLLLTVLYSQRNECSVTIRDIRLDFLEPTTPVNVRLEASVSHKILASAHHYSKTI